jgi:class 3 adenylate cyclase
MYAASNRARALLRRSFEHYLPPAVIAQMLASEALPKLGGERREISVVFTDVAGFTTFSESVEPEFLASMCNDYFEGVCAAIFAEGGMVNEFIGEAVLAFFGSRSTSRTTPIGSQRRIGDRRVRPPAQRRAGGPRHPFRPYPYRGPHRHCDGRQCRHPFPAKIFRA